VIRNASASRAAALVLAVMAMTMRLLFAPGLMPAVDTHGVATLVLCTSHGAKIIPDPDAPAGEHRKPCPFEGQASAAPVDAPQPLRLVAFEYPAIVEPTGANVSPRHDLTAPPPPQTGPPVSLA
jgi:hypothetical protein